MLSYLVRYRETLKMNLFVSRPPEVSGWLDISKLALWQASQKADSRANTKVKRVK